MVKRDLLASVIILLTIFPLFSEVDIDAKLTGLMSGTFIPDSEATSSSLATGELSVKSKGSKNVKSQLTLNFSTFKSVERLSISKAWIKFRFPLLRATLGKNRITWGEGAAFNAGDVIFDDYYAPGDAGEKLDLTADELKSVNRTMAQIVFPIGRFTFAEALYLPYDFFSNEEVGLFITGGSPQENSFNDHSYGGRFISKAGGIKLETGYIFKGDEEVHKPYVSLNGTLVIDYHLSSSINVRHDETSFDSWDNTLKISSGLFYLFDLEDDSTLTLRLEGMVRPYGEDREDGVTGNDIYQLYPEIAYVPNEEISLFLRSIISPVELSSNSTVGLNWKTYQGFTIGSFISYLKERDDDPVTTVTISVTHKF